LDFSSRICTHRLRGSDASITNDANFNIAALVRYGSRPVIASFATPCTMVHARYAYSRGSPSASSRDSTASPTRPTSTENACFAAGFDSWCLRPFKGASNITATCSGRRRANSMYAKSRTFQPIQRPVPIACRLLHGLRQFAIALDRNRGHQVVFVAEVPVGRIVRSTGPPRPTAFFLDSRGDTAWFSSLLSIDSNCCC
jgi:hypothetical protein